MSCHLEGSVAGWDDVPTRFGSMRISKDSSILGTRSSELVMMPTTSRPNSGCLFVAMDLLYVRILLMKLLVSKYRL
jgi:hypothetical protein